MDTWDDLMKFVKRKARTKTDDKIAAKLKDRPAQAGDSSEEEVKII